MRSRLRGRDVESELPLGLDLGLTSDHSRYFQRLSAFVHSESKPKPPWQHLPGRVWEDEAAMRRCIRMRVSEKAMAGLGIKTWSEKVFFHL